MRACLPVASTPRCQKDLSWAGLAPRAAALSATTEIRFSGPFFTRSRKIGSCEIDTRGWLLQINLASSTSRPWVSAAGGRPGLNFEDIATLTFAYYGYARPATCAASVDAFAGFAR